ncbi:histone deacetylase family protein [Salinicola aestuarinus]|uniref:histone deacetylase family protein n=1 Tax=Salinicola aestuarinus TaxID=1949082 RepID=UPI000DA16E57|nr:histone deacetylase family protein [Salinicola aestuarinus]
MHVFFSDSHRKHDPHFFVVRGQVRRSNEQPERAERLRRAAASAGHTLVAADAFDREPLERVHTPRYLDFLEQVHERWLTLEDRNPDEVVANVHPFPGEPCTYPEHLVGQVGFHLGDMAASIGAGTWHAAVGAAHCALSAARHVQAGHGTAYALCRPPGHHAYAERANGFCYLNNAAIAVSELRRQHAQVAVLDIDVHHGNGTQGIFYDRDDVLTVSLHADPHYMTPFFTGHAHETGRHAGEGYNLNLPLPKGLDTAGYLHSLTHALTRIAEFAPGALVVSLGLDAYANDPYQGVSVTTEGFAQITRRIAELGLPTVLVQEGGYLSDALGDNLISALSGFE